MTTRMLEPIEAPLEKHIGELLGSDTEILVCASTDLGADGCFGRQWVVVTREHCLVVSETDGDPISVPIEQIVASRTEPLVGGGRLEIARRGKPTLLLSYTESEAAKFSEIARGLDQLRTGKEFLINARPDRLRCDKCGRLLPEKNSICPACIKKSETLKRIARYLLPYKARAVTLALASAAMAATELVPPLVTKYLVDDVLVPAEGSAAPLDTRINLLGLLVLVLIGVRILSWCAEWVHGWTMAFLGAQVTADIRQQLYRRLEMLSLQFYDKRKVGTLISRATRDVGMLQDFLIDGLPYLIINGLMVFGILGFLLWMSWSLSLYILLPVPILIVWGFVFWRRMRGYFNKWSQVWANLTDRTVETLTGIRVVKAFAQERREMESFAKPNRRLRNVAQTTAVNRGIFFATITFLTGIGMLIVWLLGGQQVLSDRITLGTLLAFYSYMWLFYGPLEWFGQVNDEMTRAFAGAERIFEVIDSDPESYLDPDAVRLAPMKGGIRFNKATFGYDKSKPVLHGIDLDVKPGEMVGLVGKSGVGKTTTVNLIARFYDVDHGSIEIDGVDSRRIDLHDLRSQIGIVLEEPMLFSGTIADNIAYGKPGASFQEIMDAARVANAHNFIINKIDGYQTPVGEKGSGLSVGECQRVSIARAILHDPRVLILDEATSSVDVHTEKQMQEALGHLTEGRTTVAIAHRLSTLRDADRLIVLDDGRIVEQGTHAELMAKRGAFYDLVQLQRAAAEIIAITD
ncbi:MAG: ABC transporter ATP-binding protein [Pseudomonadales bacterium]|nr:ABC transporter ATP-binding protein [Pseudomonadales bacterium]